MQNMQIFNFQQALINVINNSNLPIGVIYFILKDIYNEIQDLYFQTVHIEQESSDQESKIPQSDTQKYDFSIPIDLSNTSVEIDNLNIEDGQE